MVCRDASVRGVSLPRIRMKQQDFCRNSGRSLFILPHQSMTARERMKLHADPEQFDLNFLAASAHVGDRRNPDLSRDQKGNGAYPAPADGIRRHSGKPSLFGSHRPDVRRRAGGRGHRYPLPRGNCQRAFPIAPVHRNRRHDRFRAAAFQPQDAALRRGGAVRHLFHHRPCDAARI